MQTQQRGSIQWKQSPTQPLQLAGASRRSVVWRIVEAVALVAKIMVAVFIGLLVFGPVACTAFVGGVAVGVLFNELADDDD